MPIACVVTLGPASFRLIDALARSGPTAFRLNTSHMTLEAVESQIKAIRAIAAEIPIVLDLQGAKMRLEEFTARPVKPGDEVLFALDSSAPGAIPAPYPELFEQLKPGDTLRLDDDKLRFTVTRTERESALARAERPGALQPRKGINVVEHPIALEDLSERARKAIELAVRYPAVRCAVSFVTDGREAEWVRTRLPGRPVTGKVERVEAAAAIHQLAASFDELWICRGDLGAQLGSPAMARFVGRLDPVALGTPVLMAGQTLEHLTAHPEPTRSEVCHLFDLIARGYSGIVLSDETAIGRDPEGAVRTAVGLLREFEADSKG